MARLALLVSALALAACSGDGGPPTREDYAEKVRDVYGEVQASFARTNVPPDELADRVADAQDELRDAADELEGTTPPEDVVAEHEQLIEGMRAYAEDLDRLRNAAERGDERTIEDFNARVAENDSVVLIAEAAESMKFKGYDLGQIAEE